MKFWELLINKYAYKLRNNWSENHDKDNDEEDTYFSQENPQDNKNNMSKNVDVKKMKMRFHKFNFPVSPNMLMT